MLVGAQQGGDPARDVLDPYVPRVLLTHLAETPDATFRVVDGSAVMADISGFTRLSERLARLGREGAEELVGALDACFTSILAVAYDNGGSLLKFGGDALLLLFDGEDHAGRAARCALGMRRRLREEGPIRTTGGQVTLRMSQGVHTGAYHLFLCGDSHRELLPAGPAVTTVVEMEKAAASGEVLMSEATARVLPASCAGEAKGPGRLLVRAPRGLPHPVPLPARLPPLDLVTACLPTELRAHLLAGERPPPEHRTISVAFVRYGGTDALLERDGPAAVAAALHRVICAVQEAADPHHVCLLQSDVDADGGKLVLTAGAPRSLGDHEERMLLTVRAILDADVPLPVRAGITAGSVFCADVGPEYRRTYSAMGDVVNLAARLTAAAPWGEAYVTPHVLGRSPTAFTTAAAESLRVKGKAKPQTATRLGRPTAGRARDHIVERFPLVGRDRELRILRAALADATGAPRTGRAIEISGEPGIGKTRLLEELRENAGDVRRLGAVCEAYTAAVPYAPWRTLLRAVLGHPPDAPADVVAGDLRAAVDRAAPDLAPWLPLLAIPLGVDVPPTPQARDLSAEARAERLHEVVGRFLRAAVPVPALVQIEAVHHMDRASAELLEHVVADLTAVRWLVVVTRRDAGDGLRLAPGPGRLRLDLSPIAPEETLALAERVAEGAPLPPHAVRLAAARSAGNPQFLRDLLRAAETDPDAPLPDSIETAAMARMDRLARADAALVRRAAVIGESFDERLLAEALEDEVPPPDEATWQRLWRYFDREAGLVRFRRPLVREVAYAALPFRTRRRVHAAVAARIQRDAGVDVDDHAAILSLHLHHAGREEAAWRFARLAGDRAREQYAYADAATLYRRALAAARALDESPIELASVWEALADAHARTGELAAADLALTAARRLVRGDRRREAELLLRHARVAERAERTVLGVRWARRGLRTAEGLDGRAGAGVRARLTALLATLRQRQGRSAEAVVLCRRAIADAEAAGEQEALAHACFILDWALVDSGRAGEARHSRRALAIYERLGQVDRQAAVLNNLGMFAYWEGRWDDAIALYGRSADASRRAGVVADAAFAHLNIGEVLSDQGRLGEAEEHLRSARRVWRGSQYAGASASAAAFLGRTLARAGRVDDGIALLTEARDELRRLRVDAEASTADAYLAEAHAFRGETSLALDAADRLLPDAGRDSALLLRTRGLALAQLGDHAAAIVALQASLASAERDGLDYETAVSLDALLAVARPAHVAARSWRRRRDALMRRLRVVALPRPPVEPATAVARAALVSPS